MEIGGNKAGDALQIFTTKQVPSPRLEPPSQELYEKKIDSERRRLAEWLL